MKIHTILIMTLCAVCAAAPLSAASVLFPDMALLKEQGIAIEDGAFVPKKKYPKPNLGGQGSLVVQPEESAAAFLASEHARRWINSLPVVEIKK
jgi:hypothetical protein